jgi:hypothetical protein
MHNLKEIILRSIECHDLLLDLRKKIGFKSRL